MLQLNEAFVRNKMKLNDKCYRNGERSIVLIYFNLINTLINELIGNFFAEVCWANMGMPIWGPGICYNDTHPHFNFHVELFLHLKWLSLDIEWVLCEESRYHNYYPNITTCDPYGSHAVMLKSDHLLFSDKIIAVEIKVITYQHEIKFGIDGYIYEFVFFLTALLYVTNLGPFWVNPHEYANISPI